MQIGHSELERGTLKSFKANEVIVREGDYGDCMYIVKTGRVRISKSVMGEDKVLAELGSGQFFGELSLINNKDRAASAVAMGDVEVIELDWETFQNNIHQHTGVARQMIRTLARRLDATLEKADNLNYVISERTRDLELKTLEAVRARESAESSSELLKASEHRLINILESMGNGVVVLNKDSQITGANTAFAELLETTEPDLRTQTLRDIVSPDDLLQLTGIEGMISSGTVRDMHVSFVTPTGERRGLEITASVMVTPNGETEGYVLVGHDSTELHESLNEQSRLYAQQQEVTQSLEETRDELERANRKKTAFFQSVSHELRTPLTTILNPLERELQEHPENPNVRIAIQSARGLLKVVNQILDFQNIATGTKAVRPAPLDLTQFVITCGKHLNVPCERRNVSFNTLQSDTAIEAGTSQEHIFVEADLDALETITYNFFSNALKFSEPGGRIDIAIDVSESTVKLRVNDDGPGIREEKLREIRRILEGAMDSLSDEDSGTRLGLTIAQTLAEQMRGQLGVESVSGEGSSFWVELPRIVGKKPLLSLLIVDDDRDILNLLKHVFSSSQVIGPIEAVGSAHEARQVLKTHRVQCILCDGDMPGEDGPSLLTHAYTSYPKTTRILMTAQADQALLQRSVNHAKVDQVLYKPVQANEWLIVLEGLIENSDVLEEVTPQMGSLELKEWQFEDIHVDFSRQHAAGRTESTAPLVLVIDSNSSNAGYFSMTLHNAGYRVASANDIASAKKLGHEYQPDVVLTDWVLGDEAGKSLVEILRTETSLRKVPIILLTAKTQEDEDLLDQDTGATALLGKPFSDQELVSVVRNILELKSRQEEVDELKAQAAESVLRRYLPPDLVDMLLSEDDSEGGANLLNADPVSVPVTVLFSDLCGFTAMTATLRAVKVARILNEYLEVMNDIIFEFGGTIDKFIGDAIMVLFGAPKAMRPDEQARRAADCALRMQEAMAELNKKWADQEIPDLQMRIGIHHGPTVVGNFGSKSEATTPRLDRP